MDWNCEIFQDSMLDFSPCFETLVISNLSKVFLLIFGLSRILFLIYNSAVGTLEKKYYLKISLVSYLLLLGTIRIITNQDFSLMNLVSIITDLTNFILVFVLTHFEHVKSKSSSSILLIFWLIEIIQLGILFRSSILNNLPQKNAFLFTFNIQYLLISILLFILENLKKVGEYSEIQENVSPEDEFNIFGKISFYWMDSLMKLGYKKVLTMNDLWNLRKKDSAELNSEKFQDAWTLELSKKRFEI